MKTSLIIDTSLFKEAKSEADKTGKTVSEIISLWARTGRDVWKKSKKSKGKEFKPLNLGDIKIDISNRKNWMEELENDGD